MKQLPNNEFLDRDLQLRVLRYLAAARPDGTYEFDQEIEGVDDVIDDSSGPLDQNASLINTVIYLAEHGLVRSGLNRQDYIGGGSRWYAADRTEITAKGLDFLAADGGLGAILGVVTVRLDAEQWAEHLASRVEKMEGVSHEERSSIAATIRKLPAKAIEKVSEKMLDWAVDHATDALPLLRTLLAQVAA
ncbi:hypothetical protein [uncultured Xylophilus sp.]|uniref:hypothetical protein n=1 Tax=uncultured Xylophilus sp. TaxID=296832 RepID=UPI0025F8F96D|nr:hypothetical protein [uncultured Xylophilus sp.]